MIGTAELVALGCIRCGACESGRGCARGIATTDDELLEMVTVEWCTQRLVNLYSAWREMLVDILYRLGLDSRGGPARPDRPADPPGLRRPKLNSIMSHSMRRTGRRVYAAVRGAASASAAACEADPPRPRRPAARRALVPAVAGSRRAAAA